MPKIANSNWAVPTQKMMTDNNKNMSVFGTPVMKKPIKKTGFNPDKYERARTSVFGIR